METMSDKLLLILWQVLESDYRRKKRMSGRHIPISTWLDALSIPQYVSLFHQYQGVEDLISHTEADIKDIGIRHGGHRAKIVSSLRILREKYNKGRGISSTNLYGIPNYNAPDPPKAPVPFTNPELLAASKEKLQLDLQKELSGDPSELRTQPWYHGNISREHAEDVIKENGDFLVRDCISKPGDFVVTCKWKGTFLNFMINSIVGNCAPGQLPPLSYKFEEDSFPTIQQLIDNYRNNQRRVTLTSGALLKNPIARCMPLSYYDTKYGAIFNFISSACQTPTESPKASPFITPENSPAMKRKGVVWTGSHPALNISASIRSGNTDMDGIDLDASDNEEDSRTLPRERCDSLPVINLIPPGDDVTSNNAKQLSQTPPLTVPAPAPTHQRSGSAPVFIDKTNNDSNNNVTPPRDTETKKTSSSAKSYSSLSRRRGKNTNSFSDKTLSSANSEASLSNPPPPKPCRVPSLKYKLKPNVVVRSIQIDDDDRDYSDYGQIKQGPSWLLAEKSSKSNNDMLSSSGLGNGVQKGRRANRMMKSSPTTNINIGQMKPGKVTDQGVPPMSIYATQGGRQPDMFPPRVPSPYTTGLVPSYNEPPSPTYRIVARSRSFQGGGEDPEEDVENNNRSNKAKGYSTLPNRSSKKKKSKDKKQSDTDSSGIEGGIADYDYPVEDDERSDFADAYTFLPRKITHPPKSYRSAINPDSFSSNLLPPGHKILDANVLRNVKVILFNKSPKTIALHITRQDLHILKGVSAKDLGMGITSGFELLTLPQGRQIRQDVLERWECLRLFTILTLMSSQTVSERAKMLSLWIQTAFELKKSVGNHFSFSSIMAGVSSSQVMRLKDTWLILRQNHTASAYVFDTKLKSAFTSLKDGSSDLPLNDISVPYILPVAQLLECDVDAILDQSLSWEEGLDPVGVAIDVLLTHLDTARVVASQYGMYRVFGHSLLENLPVDTDLDVLTNPTFHLLVLWGDKGWRAERSIRVDKLEQIFKLLSQKCQVPGDDGTEV